MTPDGPLQKNNSIAHKIAGLSPEKRALLEKKMGRNLESGHTIVARSLKSLGITHVYGISGTPIIETMAECAKAGIRTIGVRHQQAALMMAAAQNYTSGRLTAVAIISAGPAITNAVTGALVAKDNCWPLVILGGRRSLHSKEMGQFQELDGTALFRSITKWAAVVATTEAIPGYLKHAFETAVSGQPGPVYLDLPEDVLNNHTVNFHAPSPQPPPAPACDPAAIDHAAELLLNAERPGVILGKGLRWSEPYDELRQLVAKLQIPFITSPMGRGYLPDDHPLCFNSARTLLQSEADTLLILGARLDWTFRYCSEFAHNAKLIHVDIESREINRNKTPIVGIVGDIRQFLQALLSRIKATPNHNRKTWLQRLAEQREKTVLQLESSCRDTTIPMSPQRMIKEIRDVIPRDAICVTDGNVIMEAAQQILPAYLPASRFTAGSNGCLGTGIPFGIGAKFAEPERPVIVISGDTAFGFNAMELETAIRYKIPIIVIIANNEGLSGGLMEKKLYPKDYPERVTMFQPEIRYERIIDAFGGHAEYVEQPEQLGAAVQRALASGLPACINVRVAPYAPYPRPAG